ncbi:MAG: hypothetical protein ACREP9_16265 [Candidatus Dormibacteraceae bacterium]
MTADVRSWADRSNSIGFIPGKKQNRREALRAILGQLPLKSGQSIQVMMATGKEIAASVDELCGRQLSNSALARRESSGFWAATEAADRWLENSNDEELAEHLHANVKLFGELLASVEGVTTKQAIMQISHDYGLHWSSTDQLYRRLGWMEFLGLLERWGSNKFVITERGQHFLSRISLTTKEEAIGSASSVDDGDVALPAAGETVAALLARSAQQSPKRKIIIGYISRGRKAPDRDLGAGSQSPFDAVRNLVDLLGDGATVDEFYRRCAQYLGMKRTSANQTLQTMRNMRVFDMVSYNQYGPDSDVLELLELGNEIDFVRFLHSRYAFVGELLATLDEATPAPYAAKIANEVYGYSQIDSSEVRTRLGFMADAGLVERVDWTRYRATTLGKLLAAELELELPSGEVELSEMTESETDAYSSVQLVDSIASSLRNYSRRSDASTEFEIAVSTAFDFLGFDSKHLGGSGRTDVVVDAHLPDKDGFRAIVDAKSSASGVITDNLINFDKLKGHQQRHRADYGMVVGPDFSNRVREWAGNNGFTLVTVDELISLLVRHARHPLTLSELRNLFERTVDDLTEIEEQYSAAERSGVLLTKLIELLYAEAREDDPLLDGYISLENVNYVLRKELTPRPSAAAVEECLQFLAHDLVRGVVRAELKYKLADAPSNIMRRLAGLGSDLGSISVPDS